MQKKELTKEQQALLDKAATRNGKIDIAQTRATVEALVKNGMEPREARAVVMARSGTYTIKGGADVVWGVDETSEYGILESFEEDHAASMEEVPNQQGAVTGLVIWDTAMKATMTVIAESTAVLPAIGTNIEVGGVDGTVTNAKKTQGLRALQKFVIEVSGWADFEPEAT
jgi:hypothetical protein